MTRKTTAVVPYSQLQLNTTVHYTALAPLNTWAMFSQSGPLPPNQLGTDDFVLARNEVSQARTDFLQLLNADWAGADNTFENTDPPNQFLEATWRDLTASSFAAGYSESWNFLTWWKPTIFTGQTDPAVTSRSSDYRNPDPLAVLTGQTWLLSSELTGGGDDFNEAEGAYALTLDPLLGLRFRIDGTVGAPRYHPFFKVRHWRSLAGPASVTLDGAALTAGVHYRADVKPLARAHIANRLSWHSTLQNDLSVTAPDVGSGGTPVGGLTYSASGRYGNAALFDVPGKYVSIPAALNFNASIGTAEFWYRPNYNCRAVCDGVRHVLWAMEGDATHYFVFEKTVGNALRFEVRNGASTTFVTTTNFNWSANDWVHLRVTWDDSAAVGSELRIFVYEEEPVESDSGTYSAIGMVTGPCRLGGDGASAFSASGLIDEFHMYTGGPTPTRLAYGGLTANANEFMGDPSPARNYPLMNLAVDGSLRGQYVYFGADSQFRGLNVGLYVLGVGVGDGDLVWEFWNGTAWANLESVGGFTDTTRSFKRSGNVYWQDPPAWAPYSVNGGPDLYYVRIHLDPLSPGYSPAPVEGLIKTDILLVQYCGDITAANQEFVIPAPIPTAVSLQSFSATAHDVSVELSWTTASEISNLGFHLYRSAASGGPWERITSSLIPGLGSSPVGASYSWIDRGLTNGATYHYLLEDVEASGRTERHGPASATPQAAGAGSGGNGTGDSGGSDDSETGSNGDTDGSSGDTPAAGSGSGRMTYGDPSGASLRIVERGPSHTTLELLTPGFSATTEPDGSLRLELPGFVSVAAAGAVDVPTRPALVDAVAGRRVLLTSVQADDLVSFDSIRLAPAPSRDVVVTPKGMVRPGSSPRPLRESARGAGFTPRTWARLRGSLFQGDTKKARLELSPLRHDPSSGRTVLARRLLVRIEFTGIEASERTLGGSRGRRAAVAPLLKPKGVLAQLVVRQTGLHRLRFQDLYPSSRRAVTARSLRLSALSQPVPYHLEPDRALFAPGSSLFFLVSESPSLHDRGEAVYELSLGQTASRMNVVSGAPSGPAATEYLETVTLEQNRFYQSALLEAPDLWLWDLVLSPASKSYPFTVSALSPSSTSSHLRVVLQGASDFSEVDHHLRLSVNGIPVAETTWDGKVEQIVEAEVSAGILVEGPNSLEIENVGDAGAAYSMVFLNRFRVTYPRSLSASSGVLSGRFEQSGRAEVSGLAGSSFVVDHTGAPSWLGSTEPIPGGLAFRAEASRSYLVVADSAILTPEVRKATPTSLRSPLNQAAWILIAPREFLPAAQPLVALRRSQGLRAKAIALEDIASEFGFGEKSPKALHDFLTLAFHSWKTPPRYVVLLGDSTYDPHDYLGTHVQDRIPSPIVETSYLWTVSDPALAAVNGQDLIPDLAIGRLSAGTYAEAEGLVNKLVAFEQSGRTFDGKAVLVADNADIAGNFEEDQDDIAASVLGSRPVDKLYLRDIGAAAMRPSLKAALDQGPGILSYVGHGATAVWASENLWNNTDLASLDPQPQQPLLLTLNCLNGFFHFPNFDSLAEAFVKADGKGALAAFSPSGLSVNEAAHAYNKFLLQQIVSGSHARLGDALLAAQNSYANQGAFPELLSIYHLLGDPGMKIR